MQHVGYAVSATLIAAALTAGAAACASPAGQGGAAPKPTAAPDPLAGLTGNQITKRAIADLNDATSVRYAGTITGSGQHASLDLTLVHGQGCEGSMSIYGMGAVQMVYDGKSLWVRPNDAFYKGEGVSAAKISLLSGKWVKDPEKSILSALPPACSLGSITRNMSRHDTDTRKGAATSLDGQRAVIIKQIGEPGETYVVSDTARPEFLRISSSGSTTGSITFSDYGVIKTITPPPADKTLDKSNLGF